MINPRVLKNTTALAVVLALSAAPTASFAFGHGGGGHWGGGGGGGMHFSGGGGHWSGGGAMHSSGAPAAAFAAAPAARTAAAAPMARPSTPAYTGGRTAWSGGTWRGGDWRRSPHHHFFPGVAAGLAAGAVIGGSYAYYGGPDYYGPDYYADDTYYDTGPDYAAVAVVPEGGRDAAWCAQNFRSYDPASGTYLGYDGLRHPCP